MFIEPDRNSTKLRRSDMRYMSLLRSLGNYCGAFYKHSAPLALVTQRICQQYHFLYRAGGDSDLAPLFKALSLPRSLHERRISLVA
jgi:hypothetical protein